MSAPPVPLATLANPNYKGVPPYTGAWKDAAYDPELPGPLFHADQIEVPTSLEDVVKEMTKQAIRDRPAPEDMYRWAHAFFQKKLNQT